MSKSQKGGSLKKSHHHTLDCDISKIIVLVVLSHWKLGVCYSCWYYYCDEYSGPELVNLLLSKEDIVLGW